MPSVNNNYNSLTCYKIFRSLSAQQFNAWEVFPSFHRLKIIMNSNIRSQFKIMLFLEQISQHNRTAVRSPCTQRLAEYVWCPLDRSRIPNLMDIGLVVWGGGGRGNAEKRSHLCTLSFSPYKQRIINQITE
jgi:hypothetical protein